MKRELIVKANETKPCTAIVENLKSVTHAKQFHSQIPCAEPNQEFKQILGEQSLIKRGLKYSARNRLDAIDRFSIFLTTCLFEKINGSNVLKYLEMYIKNREISRSIRLDQAICHMGHQVKTFCNKNNIEIIKALGSSGYWIVRKTKKDY